MERTTWTGVGVEPLLARALPLLDRNRRSVLGLAGAPASGKSTLTTQLVAELQARHPGAVVSVGMDAFHIGHRILAERGQESIKGAPETFDALGYVALLERIRSTSDTLYAPEFHREIEDSIAHEVEISPAVRLVVTEGNYLLLPQHPWAAVRPLLDAAWFLHLDIAERQRRMVERRLRYGNTLEVATAMTLGSDEANAQLVDAEQNSPDLWIELTD